MAMAMSSAGDLDRISALPDDLLHHILGFVCDAKAVICTATLSRRWRRVWIYARQLSLFDPQVSSGVDTGDFVDWVLAQRGDADIESLVIGMSAGYWPLHASPEMVNGWLRYAMQRVVKSFRLDLPTRAWTFDRFSVVLPDHGRMTSIEIVLKSTHTFQLPVAASACRYEALTELSLVDVSISDSDGEEENSADGGGGGRRTKLGDFVSSSCCPRLRKLKISNVEGLLRLTIRSETLESFQLEFAMDLQVLDVTAPNLRVLDLEYCFGHWMMMSDENHVAVSRIASSSLQEIGIVYSDCSRRNLEIHDLSSVRRLSRLELSMHGQYYVRSEDVGFWLLEKCPSVEHVGGVWLHHDHISNIEGDIIMADLTLKGAAPFASVRSMDMTVSAHEFPDGQLVPSIFALLLRCPCLRSLRIDIIDDTNGWRRSRTCSFCDKQYAWTDHRAISLESLEEVEIIGFRGADEDMDLVSLLFASSTNSIKSMTLDKITDTPCPGTVCLKRMMAEDDNCAMTIDQKLMNIPTVDRGRWHFGNTIYTWTCYATENTIPVHAEDTSSVNSA